MSEIATAVLASAAPVTVPAPAAPPVATPPVLADGTAPATPPPAVPNSEQDRSAAKLAILAKREAAAVKAQQAATAKEAAIAEREAKVAALEARELEFNRRLRDAGLDYDQLVKQPLTAEQQIARLREDMAAKDAAAAKQTADAAAAAEQAAAAQQAANVEAFKGTINEHVADKTKYPLVNHFNSSALVFDTIEANFNQTGKIMDVPQAAQLVEAYLRKQVTESQALVNPPAPEVKVPAAPPKRDPWRSSKPTTLTNSTTAQTTTAKPARYRSDEERIEAAIAKYASK